MFVAVFLRFGRFPPRTLGVSREKFHAAFLLLFDLSEEEEEEEGLYLRIETRKRVQTNEAKSKRRRA